jgi:hypothetical protein
VEVEVAAVAARTLLVACVVVAVRLVKATAAATETMVGAVQQEILVVVAVPLVLEQTLTLLAAQLLEVLVVLEQHLLSQALL